MDQAQRILDLNDQIMSDFEVSEDAVVLIHDYQCLDALSSKMYFEDMKQRTASGTLGVFGNEGLNEHVALHHELQNLSTQERMVLGSGVLLQLLTLEKDTMFASHPAHLIGFNGKYGPYLSRHFDLDYPYGPVSIYNDLYGMDAMIIHIGKISHVPELRYVYSKRKDAVIQKNTIKSQGEVRGYLDYDVDANVITQWLLESDLIQEYELNDIKVYAYRYQDLIDELKLK